MFKAGTLSLNMCRTPDHPKTKDSFKPNTVEEQPVTSAKPSMSHKAIEEVQAVQEEEEYNTDSDSDHPMFSLSHHYMKWTNG